MANHKQYIVLPILLVLAIGCSNRTQLPKNESTDNDIIVKATFTEGTSALVGQLESTGGTPSVPIANTVVRLAQVYWNDDRSEGAFVLEGATSPSTITNERGEFILNDIPPGDYVIVVGEVLGYHIIVSERNGKAMVVSVKAGEVTHIGNLRVPYSP